MSITEDSYIDKVRNLLLRFSESGNLLNFECPFCHEGKSAGRLKRAFIMKDKGYSFFCHNCSSSYSFRSFLFELDRDVYYQYQQENRMDKFTDDNNYIKQRIESEKPTNLNSAEFESLSETFSRNLYKVRESKIALNYLRMRKVPENIIDKLLYYYNDRPTTDKRYNNSIVFPFYTNNYEKYYGFQSRQLANKFFHIELQDPSYPKIWNLFNVDLKKPVYIFEGFFDSIVIENSIALNGADISSKFLSQMKKPVFVFDNDKTGFNKMKKYCDLGHDVFVYPETFKFKDFNEYYCKDNPNINQIESLIKKNIHDPFSAQMLLMSRSFR